MMGSIVLSETINYSTELLFCDTIAWNHFRVDEWSISAFVVGHFLQDFLNFSGIAKLSEHTSQEFRSKTSIWCSIFQGWKNGLSRLIIGYQGMRRYVMSYPAYMPPPTRYNSFSNEPLHHTLRRWKAEWINVFTHQNPLRLAKYSINTLQAISAR